MVDYVTVPCFWTTLQQSGAGTAWNNAGQVDRRDRTVASVTLAAGGDSKNIDLIGIRAGTLAGLPADADIEVLELEVWVFRGANLASAIKTLTLQRLDAALAPIGANLADSSNFWRVVAQFFTGDFDFHQYYGGIPAWTTLPTFSELQNGFNLRLAAHNYHGSAPATAYIETIEVYARLAVTVPQGADGSAPGEVIAPGQQDPNLLSPAATLQDQIAGLERLGADNTDVNWLVTVFGWDSEAGVEAIDRWTLATAEPFRTGPLDADPNAIWLPRLRKLITRQDLMAPIAMVSAGGGSSEGRRLSDPSGRGGGGEMVVALEPDGRLDYLRHRAYINRRVEIRAQLNGLAYGQYPLIATLVIGGAPKIDITRNLMTFPLAERWELLRTNLLTSTFAGTGGAEGGDDLKNTPKPLLVGRAFNLPPVQADATAFLNVFNSDRKAQEVSARWDDGNTDTGTITSTNLRTGVIDRAAAPVGIFTIDAKGIVEENFMKNSRGPDGSGTDGWGGSGYSVAKTWGADGSWGGSRITVTAANAKLTFTLVGSPSGLPSAFVRFWFRAVSGSPTIALAGGVAAALTDRWELYFVAIPSPTYGGVELEIDELVNGSVFEMDYGGYGQGSSAPGWPIATTTAAVAVYPETVVPVTRQLLAMAGFDPFNDFDNATLDAYQQSDETAVLGGWYREPTTLAEGLAEYWLSRFAAARFDAQGRFGLGRLGLPGVNPAAVFTPQTNLLAAEEMEQFAAVREVAVAWGYNHQLQESGSRQARTIGRWAWRSATNQAVALYVGSTAISRLEIYTRLALAADAEALAAQALALYQPGRRRVRLTCTLDGALALQTGAKVRWVWPGLTYDRGSAPAYAEGQVTAKQIDAGAGRIILEVYST